MNNKLGFNYHYLYEQNDNVDKFYALLKFLETFYLLSIVSFTFHFSLMPIYTDKS